jgi:hypothetical protein
MSLSIIYWKIIRWFEKEQQVDCSSICFMQMIWMSLPYDIIYASIARLGVNTIHQLTLRIWIYYGLSYIEMINLIPISFLMLFGNVITRLITALYNNIRENIQILQTLIVLRPLSSLPKVWEIAEVGREMQQMK